MTTRRWSFALALLGVCTNCSATDADLRRSRPPEEAVPKPPKEGEVNNAIKVLGEAHSDTVVSPTDATPSPDGRQVYFVGNTPTEEGSAGGVYRAQADGSEVTTLDAGGALSAPMGISISIDGKTLFVADLSAGDGGAILSGPADGSLPLTPMAGTEGLAPCSVSVSMVGSEPWVYFTAESPDGLGRALYRVAPSASGAPIELVASGGPLVAPAGLYARTDGSVLVIDALADDGRAALLLVENGEITPLITGLGVGFPAGLTLDRDERVALISGLSPSTGRDVVYVVDLESLDVYLVTDPVSQFSEPAGLHRAHNSDVFAWADSEANGTGTVFVLSF